MKLDLSTKTDIVIAIGNKQLETIKPELEVVATFPTWIYHHAFTDDERKLIDAMPRKWRVETDYVARYHFRLRRVLADNEPLYRAVDGMLTLFDGFVRKTGDARFHVCTRHNYGFSAMFVIRKTKDVDLIDRIIPLCVADSVTKACPGLDMMRTHAVEALLQDKGKQEQLVQTWKRIEDFIGALRSLADVVKNDLHSKRAAQAALPQFAAIIDEVCLRHDPEKAVSEKAVACSVLEGLGVECEEGDE